MAGNTRLPHRAPTEATESIVAQRPRKRSRVLNDREHLVALHQKQDKHHFLAKASDAKPLGGRKSHSKSCHQECICHSRNLSAIMEEFDPAQC